METFITYPEFYVIPQIESLIKEYAKQLDEVFPNMSYQDAVFFLSRFAVKIYSRMDDMIQVERLTSSPPSDKEYSWDILTNPKKNIVIAQMKEGEILKTFKTLSEIPSYLKRKDATDEEVLIYIEKCLTNKRVSAYGFTWKFVSIS